MLTASIIHWPNRCIYNPIASFFFCYIQQIRETPSYPNHKHYTTIHHARPCTSIILAKYRRYGPNSSIPRVFTVPSSLNTGTEPNSLVSQALDPTHSLRALSSSVLQALDLTHSLSRLMGALDPTHSLQALSPTHSSYGLYLEISSFVFTGTEPNSFVLRVPDPTHSLRALSPAHSS